MSNELKKLLHRDTLEPGPTIIDVLEMEKPFVIDIYSPEQDKHHSHHLGLYFHRGDDYPTGGDYPTFIEKGKELGNQNLVNGVCRIDVPKKRILFDPHAVSGKWRERIQAYGGVDLLYPGFLYDVLAELTQEGGYGLLQVTTIYYKPEIVAEDDNPSRLDMGKYTAVIRAQREFNRATGKHQNEAFHVEGPISIEDILNGKFIKPTLAIKDKKQYVDRISGGW